VDQVGVVQIGVVQVGVVQVEVVQVGVVQVGVVQMGVDQVGVDRLEVDHWQGVVLRQVTLLVRFSGWLAHCFKVLYGPIHSAIRTRYPRWVK
jgi:hypothetical protein